MLEIACDESGSEGEKLIGGATDVFAHASVRLSVEAAAEIMREVRERAPSRAREYKAYMILRERHRDALVWLLGASGPLYGDAHVFLVDKALFVFGKLSEAGAQVTRSDLGSPEWQARLGSFNERVRADRTGSLDPIVPALESAVARWSVDGAPVSIVHDRQPALTEERIAMLKESTGLLAALRLVDSRDDLRVQVADALAGAARKIASDELNGRGDPELTALLRPYVDPSSEWVASLP